MNERIESIDLEFDDLGEAQLETLREEISEHFENHSK